MGLFEWENERIKNLDVWDIGLTKLAVLAFTLMLVVWWPVLASLDWWVYAVVFVLAAIRPASRFLA